MLRWTGTAFAAALMLAAGSAIWADDVVRLGGPAAQNSIQGGTDTELVRGFHGGGHSGFHGGHSGFHGGHSFHHGHFGHSNYGARFYTPYFSAGFYGRPYYASYYRPYYYGSYYPTYYQPYDYGSYYNYPCAGDVAPALTLQSRSLQFAQPSYQTAPQQQPFMPPTGPNPGNFQYDGGPNQQVPMPYPGADTNPAKAPRAIIPLDGKLVALPSTISGGFSPVSLMPPSTTATKNSVPRVTYPAYGEQR